MNAERQKEKTYQAITFFLTNTNNCYKKKLYKLLFLLDFEFFEAAGRPVTHLDYFAWKMGPVPTELQEAIDCHEEELVRRFDINVEQVGDYAAVRLVNKSDFDQRYFSEKELEILHQLADRWRDASAKDLEDFTHREGSPWDKVWSVEHKRQQLIPLDYALDYLGEEDRNAVREIANERAAFIANYQ